jgi:hypothetical protein
MRNDDRVIMELVVRGEVVMEASCKMIIRHMKELYKRWYYAYGLASKRDWEIHIRMPSKMDADKKTIKFPKKNVIFELQNTINNESTNTEHRPESGQPADY